MFYRSYCTVLRSILLTSPLTLSWIQFGSALTRLALEALLGSMICPPLHLVMLSITASATTEGSMISTRCLLSSSSTGLRSGVRTQFGWIDVVSTFGLL